MDSFRSDFIARVARRARVLVVAVHERRNVLRWQVLDTVACVAYMSYTMRVFEGLCRQMGRATTARWTCHNVQSQFASGWPAIDKLPWRMCSWDVQRVARVLQSLQSALWCHHGSSKCNRRHTNVLAPIYSCRLPLPPSLPNDSGATMVAPESSGCHGT